MLVTSHFISSFSRLPNPNILSAQLLISGFAPYYCQVHSPLWAGALVIVAEKSEEKNNFEEEKNQAGKRPFHEEGQRWRLAENLGPPVEEKVSSIAQALYEEGNWMVVIALATWEELATNWLGPGPDADGLSKLMDVSGRGSFTKVISWD